MKTFKTASLALVALTGFATFANTIVASAEETIRPISADITGIMPVEGEEGEGEEVVYTTKFVELKDGKQSELKTAHTGSSFASADKINKYQLIDSQISEDGLTLTYVYVPVEEAEVITYTTKFVEIKDDQQVEIGEEQTGSTFKNASQIEDYRLVGSKVSEDGLTLTYIYESNSTTTINFTAKYNDGRADAHYSWTFPAGTRVTYGELFEKAGLNPEDFDLSDYDNVIA